MTSSTGSSLSGATTAQLHQWLTEISAELHRRTSEPIVAAPPWAQASAPSPPQALATAAEDARMLAIEARLEEALARPQTVVVSQHRSEPPRRPAIGAGGDDHGGYVNSTASVSLFQEREIRSHLPPGTMIITPATDPDLARQLGNMMPRQTEDGAVQGNGIGLVRPAVLEAE